MFTHDNNSKNNLLKIVKLIKVKKKILKLYTFISNKLRNFIKRNYVFLNCYCSKNDPMKIGKIVKTEKI